MCIVLLAGSALGCILASALLMLCIWWTHKPLRRRTDNGGRDHE